jgi:hypothetical protein
VLFFDKLFELDVFPLKLFFNYKELSSNDVLCIKQIKKLLK